MSLVMVFSMSSVLLSSNPMTAAIVEGVVLQASCIAIARWYTNCRASSKAKVCAATRAENSPRECPATMLGSMFCSFALMVE